MTDLTLEQQIDLARWMFPRSWAKAETLTGEPRRRRMRALRQKAAPVLQVQWLRHNGHSCRDCRFMLPGDGLSVRGSVCDYHSDNDGWMRTTPEHICHEWKAKP